MRKPRNFETYQLNEDSFSRFLSLIEVGDCVVLLLYIRSHRLSSMLVDQVAINFKDPQVPVRMIPVGIGTSASALNGAFMDDLRSKTRIPELPAICVIQKSEEEGKFPYKVERCVFAGGDQIAQRCCLAKAVDLVRIWRENPLSAHE